MREAEIARIISAPLSYPLCPRVSDNECSRPLMYRGRLPLGEWDTQLTKPGGLIEIPTLESDPAVGDVEEAAPTQLERPAVW